MAEATIRVRQGDQTWQAELIPTGTTIGRGDQCDIVIHSSHVSRRHARFFLNSEGEWFVEDLGSSNGTFVNGERVESCPISQADVVEIGPASLSFSPPLEQATLPLTQAPNIIIQDFGTEVFYDRPRLQDCTCPPCPERLDQVSQYLSELTHAALYPEVCRLLTQEPKTAAAVFRMPCAATSVPAVPAIMACHFGSSPEEARAEGGGMGRYPSHLAFRVSHRLLEAIRKDGRPLMAKGIFSCDSLITLSSIDEHSPRALICASLGATGQTVDLLYVDVPIDDHRGPSAEEMFVFVQSVAKLVATKGVVP